MKRISGLIAALLVSAAPATSFAQRDYTSFSLHIENDAFNNSDTGYTNGIRLAWSVMRYRPGMRHVVNYSLPGAIDRVLGTKLFGIKWLTLAPLRLKQLGVVPDTLSGQKCRPNGDRGDRRKGACTILNVGLAQLMYTPDSLATTDVQAFDQPYAGFLYLSAGVTTLDSPRQRGDSTNWFVYTEVSNQILLGVTGPAAQAEATQSIAHWTWATGSGRPLGWDNQLRSSVQVGLITDIAARPYWAEFCRNDCDGTIDDRRWLDFTPHAEMVASTHMVRLTEGITVRLGNRMPEMIGTLRIPVGAPRADESSCKLVVFCERHWYYVFANADIRQVPYNMFLAGGRADGGPNGWRNIRQIEPRHHVREVAGGLAFGNSRMTARGQLAFRTPEYDVIGGNRSKGWHGFGSFMVSMHPRPN